MVYARGVQHLVRTSMEKLYFNFIATLASICFASFLQYGISTSIKCLSFLKLIFG